jgi:hypothetical protein
MRPRVMIVANILFAWIAAAIGGLVGWYLRGRHERARQRQLPPATARKIARAARANRAELPLIPMDTDEENTQ